MHQSKTWIETQILVDRHCKTFGVRPDSWNCTLSWNKEHSKSPQSSPKPTFELRISKEEIVKKMYFNIVKKIKFDK